MSTKSILGATLPPAPPIHGPQRSTAELSFLGDYTGCLKLVRDCWALLVGGGHIGRPVFFKIV